MSALVLCLIPKPPSAVLLPSSVASAQLSFFVTENAVIDVTVRKMVTNIAPLHIFQIKKNYPNTCSQS
jgi:hypothetical protein